MFFILCDLRTCIPTRFTLAEWAQEFSDLRKENVRVHAPLKERDHFQGNFKNVVSFFIGAAGPLWFSGWYFFVKNLMRLSLYIWQWLQAGGSLPEPVEWRRTSMETEGRIRRQYCTVSSMLIENFKTNIVAQWSFFIQNIHIDAVNHLKKMV